MSLTAHRWVASVLDDEQTGLDQTARHMLRELADYANDDGVCWPGTDALARRLGVHYDTAYRARRRLVDAGFIVYTPGGAGRGNTGLYRLLIPARLSTRSAPARTYLTRLGPRQIRERTASDPGKDRAGAVRTSNEPLYEPRADDVVPAFTDAAGAREWSKLRK